MKRIPELVKGLVNRFALPLLLGGALMAFPAMAANRGGGGFRGGGPPRGGFSGQSFNRGPSVNRGPVYRAPVYPVRPGYGYYGPSIGIGVYPAPYYGYGYGGYGYAPDYYGYAPDYGYAPAPAPCDPAGYYDQNGNWIQYPGCAVDPNSQPAPAPAPGY